MFTFGQRNTLLGLDIHEDRLLLVELVVEKKGCLLRHALWDELSPQSIVDGKVEDVDGIAERLKGAVKKHGVKGRRVNLAVPSEHVLLRHMRLPQLPRKNLEKLIKLELETQVHLPFEDPVIDFVFEEARDAEQEGEMRPLSADTEHNSNKLVDVTVVAAPREIIAGYTAVVKKAGFVPVSVDLRALAIFRMMQKLAPDPMPGTVLVVDVSHQSTDIHIISNNVLRFSRNLSTSLSSFHVESEIPSRARLHFLDKLERQTDYDSLAAELAFEIERSTNFFQYTLNNRTQKVEAVVLCGILPSGGGFAQQLQARLDVPVCCASFGNLAFAAGRMPAVSALYPFCVPIGLALKGVTE